MFVYKSSNIKCSYIVKVPVSNVCISSKVPKPTCKCTIHGQLSPGDDHPA